MPSLADYLLANTTGGNFGTMSPGEEAVAVTPGSVLDALGRSAYRLGATPRDAMRTGVQPTGGMVSDVDMARAQLGEADIGKRTGEGALTMMGAGGAFPAEANALNMGIKAYHGSPHDFERFDMSKIGTGEGAQSYGHGLYFAENPTVAEEYKKTFDARSGAEHDAKMYQVDIDADPEHFIDWHKPLGEQPHVMKNAPQLLEAAKEEAQSRLISATTKKRADELYEMVKDPSKAPGEFALRAREGRIQGNKGIDNAGLLAEELKQAGIPGIKYLDQGSRIDPERLKAAEANFAKFSSSEDPVDLLQASHAQEEISRLKATKPTSNYVVFDDKLIDILRKYGLAAGSAGAGGALLDLSRQQQPAQQ